MSKIRLTNFHKDIFEDFKKLCCWAVPKLIRWEPFSQDEIIVYLDDSVVLYDGVMKNLRSAETYEKLIENCFPHDFDKWQEEFSYRLYRMIRSKGYSQDELSWLVGISGGMMSHYINGNSTPTLKNFIKIVRAMELTDDEVLRLLCYRG